MKKIWIFLAAGLLVACVCPSLPVLAPSGRHNQPTQARAPTLTHTPETTISQGELTIIRLHPADGNLENLLHEEAGKAHALGQRMFVEFDATW